MSAFSGLYAQSEQNSLLAMSETFFGWTTSSLNDSLVDKSLDVVDAVVNIDQEGDQLSPMEWFNCNRNGYYNNNLTIAHLNVNSIYGKSDEVINHTRQLFFWHSFHQRKQDWWYCGLLSLLVYSLTRNIEILEEIEGREEVHKIQYNGLLTAKSLWSHNRRWILV